MIRRWPPDFWETMSLHFILVAGPLVRASSWEPTAECLRAAGCHVQVPDVLAHHRSPPAWSAWTAQLLEHITRGDEPIVVGHSSASALAADLATRLPVRGIIIVDGDVPPSRGAAFPVSPPFTISSRALSNPTACFRSGRDGLPAIRGVCLLSVWMFWRVTRRHSPGSKANFHGCISVGSTTRSNSPRGSISLPVSSRLQRFMITQP
jgi:pimeloyl-ACP methyl ester carboxylesterase